jgi:hypothetical protein
MKGSRLSPETLVAQALGEIDPVSGALTPPISVSTNFEQAADGSYHQARVYTRADNPDLRARRADDRDARRCGRRMHPVRVGHGGGDRGVPVAAARRPRRGLADALLGCAQVAGQAAATAIRPGATRLVWSR